MIKDKYEFILKEFHGLIYLFYLLLIGIGMLFNYYKFPDYDINIFQYATIFDFLIAPFKDGRIVKYALLAVLIVAGLLLFFTLSQKFRIYFERRKDENYRPKRNKIDEFAKKKGLSVLLAAFGVLLMFYTYSSNYAKEYAKELKVELKNQPEINFEFINGDCERGLMLGKTEGYLFLLQKEDVGIFPVDNVKKIGGR